MGQEYEIRRARRDERDVVLSLWLALIDHHRRLTPAYPVPAGVRPGLQSEIERGLSRPQCRIWLALHAGRPVGFAFADAGTPRSDAENGVGWIHELWVEPDFRRRGIALRLVEEARAFLAERCRRIAVRVEAANPEGLAFWRAQGFRDRAHLLELADP
jgi:ribosomal protein S18 acetylase RimI-like enzyme